MNVFRNRQRAQRAHRREKIRLVSQIRRSGLAYRRYRRRYAFLGRSRALLERSCFGLARDRALLERQWAPLRGSWETLWGTLNRFRRQHRQLRLRLRDLERRRAPAILYGFLLERRQALLRAEGRVAHSRRRTLGLFRRRLRRDFGRRFSPGYRLPRRLRQRRLLLRRRRRPQLRRWEPRNRGGQKPQPGRTSGARGAPQPSGRPHRRAARRARRQLPRHMRRQQRRLRRLRPHRRGRLVTKASKRPPPLFAAPKEQKISTQSWKTLQRPLPRTLSFRYTKPGHTQATGRWRFPATPALVVRRGRLKRLPFRRVPAAILPQRGETLRAKLLHPGADRQRHSSRLPLVHYRVLELTIGDPTALDEDGNELPPERWLVLERSYGPVGYDTLMADLFGVLTPALRLMAKVVGHKSARRTVYHARDGVPLAQRRKLIFGWLRDLVNKNPDYNYLRRNTLRKRPSKRVLLRPERSRRLTEPFQSRLYAELHQLLQPEEPIMERLEDFDEKSHQLRLTRRHYR